jgi:glutaconate CoA-transferase subunit A
VGEIVALSEAIAELVRDGDTVALEGFTHLIPHAAGHELIRQQRRELALIRMTPDVIYDQLIGAGCARRLTFSWGGNPGVGSLHRLRDAVEHGWPLPLELGEAAMAAARGGCREPAARRASRIRRHRPRGTHAEACDDHMPVHRRAARGRSRHRPVGIVHAQQADRAGNVLLWGITGVQKEVVLASARSLVTVEEVVDGLEPRAGGVVIPGWVIDAVAVAPRGAHPSYAHGYYDRDNAFYVRWDEIARDRDRFTAWIDRHVRGTRDVEEYHRSLAETA